VQIWVGAALAYIRNLPQVWIFALAVPRQEETKAPSEEEQPKWYTRPLVVRPVVVIMTVLGIAGSVLGIAGYPIALHVGALRTFILSAAILPYLLEYIQGTTGAGQGWSGALFNHWLRNRKRQEKLPWFSWEFTRSCALGMSVTALSSVGLQLLTDLITRGATNPLAVEGIAAMMSAVIATLRGGIIAPIVFGLVGSNSGDGLRAMWADVRGLARYVDRFVSRLLTRRW
jgi:hypothetical protein